MNALGLALASRRQYAIAMWVVIGLTLATALVFPIASLKLPVVAPFLSMYTVFAGTADAMTAFLLASQARVTRTWSLLLLAAGYFYSAVCIAPHILTFPGVFSETGLLGAGPQTAVWFWVWWHGGFPLFVIAFSAYERYRARAASRAPITIGHILVLALAVALMVTAILIFTLTCPGTLPRLIEHGRYDLLITTGVGPTVIATIAAALVTLTLVTRLRTATQLWVAVALVASLCDCALTLVAGGRYTAGWYLARIESLIAAVVMLCSYLAALDGIFDRLARLSAIDGLTGLANRRSFDEMLDLQLAASNRGRHPVSLLMLDLDSFKAYNDTYGHPKGDDALRIVADAIAAAVPRGSDFAARYGGEEFAVILPATAEHGARLVAERIRTSIAQRGVPHERSRHNLLTVSIGAATARAFEPEFTSLLSRADIALYEAKAKGGNTVVDAEPPARTKPFVSTVPA